MEIRYSVLASGSKGNSTFIEIDGIKILFDLGTNLKYITNALLSIDVDPKDINYVFISHTHDDHISALERFTKKFNPIVCLTAGMMNELPNMNDYNNILLYGDELFIKDIRIKAIKTSHDSPDSRSFIVSYKDKKLVYLTDTGYLNQKYFKFMYDSNVFLFESNHDIEMLMNGRYPKWLKDRVVGPVGHLSNKDSAIYLAKLIGDDTKDIVLLHLSHENNEEEKAIKTHLDIYKEYDINFKNVRVSKQDGIVEGKI